MLQRDKFAASVKRDDESRDVTDVDDLPHNAGRRSITWSGDCLWVKDPNFLRPHAPDPVASEDPPGNLTTQQIGGADETGDELRLRSLVDLSGRTDLLDPTEGRRRCGQTS